MAGGATGGYCAIGSWVIETLPTTMMKSAMTHAKIGRSMKNLAMGPSYRDAAEAADAAGWGAPLPTAPEGLPLLAGCHGTGLTVAPGRSF